MEKLINNFKISFTKGDTYALAIKIKNIAEDLRTAYFTVKENPDDEPRIQKTLGAGIDKIDDRAYKNEKTYKLQLQAEDTINLEANVQYLYDFQVSVDNVVKTLLSGVFVVTHSVSGAGAITTPTLDVEVDAELEAELDTTPATNGIEYEQDPVANAKIGDLTALKTRAKENLVQAINETAGVLDGTIKVKQAEHADLASYAYEAGKAEEASLIGQSFLDNGRLALRTAIEACPATSITESIATNVLGGTEKSGTYYTDLKYEKLPNLVNGIYWTGGHSFIYEDGSPSLGAWHTIIRTGGATDCTIIAIPVNSDKDILMTRIAYASGVLVTEKAWVKFSDKRNTAEKLYANEADAVNGLEIKKDENGVLKIGDISIPQKKLIWSDLTNTSEFYPSKPKTITLNENLNLGDTIEIEITPSSYIHKKWKIRGVVGKTPDETAGKILFNPIYSWKNGYTPTTEYGIIVTFEKSNELSFVGTIARYFDGGTELTEHSDTYKAIVTKVYKIIE